MQGLALGSLNYRDENQYQNTNMGRVSAHQFEILLQSDYTQLISPPAGLCTPFLFSRLLIPLAMRIPGLRLVSEPVGPGETRSEFLGLWRSRASPSSELILSW